MCCYEEQDTTIASQSIGLVSYRIESDHLVGLLIYRTQIVPKDSATIPGYPCLSIHADHRSMCKYAGKDDSNYQKVSGFLRRWAEDIRKSLGAEAAEKVCPLIQFRLRTNRLLTPNQAFTVFRNHQLSEQ